MNRDAYLVKLAEKTVLIVVARKQEERRRALITGGYEFPGRREERVPLVLGYCNGESYVNTNNSRKTESKIEGSFERKVREIKL